MPQEPATTDGFAPLIRRGGLTPRVGVVLGSGLADLARRVEIAAQVDLDDALGLSAAQVPGHLRRAIVGRWGPTPIVMLAGRYHLYQGLSAEQVAAPVRALGEIGVRTLILTNAAGGLDPAFQVGDLMVIRDHLNLPGLAGASPLIPPPGDAVPFVSMRDAYSPRLRALAAAAVGAIDLELREGIYAMVAGPSYETAAELRMLRMLGADAVGMSTVPEVVAARALGIEVLAVSMITNRAVADEPAAPDHAEVLRAGRQAAGRVERWLDAVLSHLDPTA